MVLSKKYMNNCPELTWRRPGLNILGLCITPDLLSRAYLAYHGTCRPGIGILGLCITPDLLSRAYLAYHGTCRPGLGVLGLCITPDRNWTVLSGAYLA